MITSLRILYIDDNQTDRKLICNALEKEQSNIQVYVADSKEVFESKIAEDKFDVVLSDIQVLGYKKLQILDFVNQHKPSLPVIIITGSGSEEIAVESIRRGASDYITKTQKNIQNLPRALKNIVEKKRLSDEQQRTTHTLRESEAKWRSLVENTPDVIITIDRTGTILFINHTFSKEIQAEQTIGTNVCDWVSPEYHNIIREAIQRTFETGKNDKYETTRKQPDGNILWYSTTIGPIKQDDKIVALTLTTRDITARKRTEEALCKSEAFLKLQIDRLPIGCIIWNPDFRVISWNPAAEAIFGFTFSEAIGKHPYDFIVPKQAQPHVDNIWHRLLEGDATAHSENENITKDGRNIICSWINTPLKESDGSIIGVLSTVQNNTDYRHAEEALRQSEERFRTVYENSTIGLYRTTPDGKILLANPTLVKMLGFSSFDELTTRNLEYGGYEPAYSRATFLQHIEQETEVKGLESVWKKKDGTILHVRESARAIRDNRGRTLYYDGTVEDITDRKLVEQALTDSEIRYRAIVEDQSELICRYLPDGKITFINQAYCRYFGKKPDELIGNIFYPLVIEEDRKKVEKLIATLSRQNPTVTVEERVISPDGHICWQQWVNRLILDEQNQVIEIQAVGRDITERKRADEVLRNHETRLRALINNTRDTIWSIDKKYHLTAANEEFFREFNAAIGKEIGIGDSVLHKSLPPDMITSWKEYYDRAFSGETFRVETESPTGDGDILFRENAFNPIRGISGEIIGIACFSHDITESKKAAEALKESESKFRTVADTSVAAIIIYQGENFVYINPAAEQITGYTIDEALKMKFWEVVHPDFREQVREHGFARQRGEPVPTRYEFKILTKSGEEKWLDFGAKPIQFGGRPAALGIALDITERKKVEAKLIVSYEQLRQLTARLHAIREEESARIAREIHDELGQTLTGIKMDLSFIEDSLICLNQPPQCQKLVSKLSSISNLTDSAIQTMRKITTELRPAILDSMGLSAAIEWQAEEFQHRTGIKCDYLTSHETLHVNRNYSIAIFRILQESLTNIIRHAKASRVTIQLASEENNIILRIEDNGRGISESDVKKTNTFGILGIKERVWLLKGTIEINGKTNQGTIITVKIPLK